MAKDNGVAKSEREYGGKEQRKIGWPRVKENKVASEGEYGGQE